MKRNDYCINTYGNDALRSEYPSIFEGELDR